MKASGTGEVEPAPSWRRASSGPAKAGRKIGVDQPLHGAAAAAVGELDGLVAGERHRAGQGEVVHGGMPRRPR